MKSVQFKKAASAMLVALASVHGVDARADSIVGGSNAKAGASPAIVGGSPAIVGGSPAIVGGTNAVAHGLPHSSTAAPASTGTRRR